MPGIAAMQINITSDIGGLLKGISESVKSLKGLETAGERTAKATEKTTSVVAKAWGAVKFAIAGTVAAIGTRATWGALTGATELVDKLGKASARLGVGVEQMSALRFAAEEADVPFENLTKMVSRASKSVAELAQKQDNVFVGRFQIRLKDSEGKLRSINDLLPEIAQGIESVDSEAEQLRLADKFFGSKNGEGGNFVQLLRESGGFVQNLAVQTERAKRLGVVFSQEQVDKLTAFNDAVGRIGEAWLGVRVKIATKVAPYLTDFANDIATFVASIPEIVGKVAEVISKSFTDPQLREDLQAFLASLFDIWWTHQHGVAALLVAGMYDLFARVIPAMVLPAAAALGRNIAIKLMHGMADALDWATDNGVVKGIFPSWGSNITKGISATLRSVATAGELSESAEGVSAAIWDALSGPTAMSLEASNYIDNMSNAIATAIERGDSLFKIREIIAKHSMDLGALFTKKGDDKPEKKLSDLQQRVNTFAEESSKAIAGFSQSFSDAWTDIIFGGKASFSELAKGWAKTLTSMALNTLVFAPIFKTLGTQFGSWVSGNSSSNPPAAPDVSKVQALGGVWSSGKMQAFADGGVVTGPRLFGMAGGGLGLMGEAGPEAIMPLDRVGGKLGVRASGGGTVVQIIDQRSGGSPVQVRESTGPDGRKVIQALVRDEVAGMVRDGTMDRVLGGSYRGVARRPARR